MGHGPFAWHDAEARFRAAFEEAGVGMAIVGLDGEFLRINRELGRMLGHAPDSLKGVEAIAVVSPPEEVAQRRATLALMGRGDLAGDRVDLRYLRGDGSSIWCSTTVSAVRGEDDAPKYLLVQFTDVTARKEAEARAARQVDRQTLLARITRLALDEHDLGELRRRTIEALVADLDVALVGIARFRSDDMLEDRGGNVAVDPAHAAHVRATGAPVLIRDARTETRFAAGGLLARGVRSGLAVPVVGGPDGSSLGMIVLYAPEPDAFDDELLAFLESVANVLMAAGRRVWAEQGLRHQALHDPLTELPNRALLLDRLRHGLARARREGGWVALLTLDIDDFKSVNDSLGHSAGDALLRGLAPRLAQALRPSDTLARVGGDAFAIVCDGLNDAAESATIADRLLEVIAQPLTTGGVQFRVSASIGVALAGPGAAHTAEDLIRDADVAMYRAKAAGRARVEVFDDRMRQEIVERVALTNDLRAAIERGELHVAYQPIVSFAERRVVGLEALARWTHPRRGEVSPGRFIPLAEQHGLIGSLGAWVLDHSLDQLAHWRDEGLAPGGLELSVNVSRWQLSRPSLAGDIVAALRERDLPARQLTVEITETALMDDADVAEATLKDLHRHGVRIALDDFGVGQSSLACLRDLPLNGVKLDRRFITRLATTREAGAIVRAVADMARTLRFPVVAEGIESDAQAAVVEALGCELGQGYLFSRPIGPGEVAGTVQRLDAQLGRGGSVPVPSHRI